MTSNTRAMLLVNFLLYVCLAAGPFSCDDPREPNGNVNLGAGYWFIFDAYGSNIIYSPQDSTSGEGLSIIPPTVTHYAWNDSCIVAVSRDRLSPVDCYWVVQKSVAIDVNSTVLDTLTDGQVINRTTNLIGPIDSANFASVLRTTGLVLRGGFPR